MAELTISEVGRRTGLRPSAIRYYEQVKLLPPARRASGQRRYDDAIVNRLAVIRTAQAAGFSLEEIRQLVIGAGRSTPISARWQKLAAGKIVDLEAQIERIRMMKDLLLRLQSCCRCETVEECGAGILRNRR